MNISKHACAKCNHIDGRWVKEKLSEGMKLNQIMCRNCGARQIKEKSK